MRTLKRYEHNENETLRCSNLMYGMMSWFYNGGHYKSCKLDEAKRIDQRVFGPAVAKGLIEQDGPMWRITLAGVQWMKSFHSRDAWKENTSRDFSVYVKVQRTRLRIVHRKPAGVEQTTRARAATA
jgi:hypothetical protein